MKQIYLTAMDDELFNAWEYACGGIDIVTVYKGSILGLDVDAVVSPANSFGFMDGGIDYAYTQCFGPSVQDDVQEKIKKDFDGELLVGQALIVSTHKTPIYALVSAPTMRVPMILGAETINPYLAARAALRALEDYPHIETVAFPGLGTGVGRVPPLVCAQQVRAAIGEVCIPELHPLNVFPRSWSDAQINHQKLYTTTITDLQKG